ncbi:response regulator [Roseibium aestuarii]|uniref:Response regulator n=1 Tax=Roseibium aestuarii TaxID=2600299 RepID=A0ABW4JUS9_9HYPH|nr:response regulator [Roseibium aestuarii]
MKNHAAFGLAIEDLDIVIVDDSKPMQSILRSILMSFKVARVRVFDSVDEALPAMVSEPPNLILTDWRMAPTSGYQLLKLIRHRHMDPLCYVPLLFITAHGTRALVDRALRSGAHHLLVKPVAPSTLYNRLRWLMADSRPLVLDNSGFYNIQGVHKLLDAQKERTRSLDNARQLQERSVQNLVKVRGAVEKEFAGVAPQMSGSAEPEATPAAGARTAGKGGKGSSKGSGKGSRGSFAAPSRISGRAR